jgi:hypothetical protein
MTITEALKETPRAVRFDEDGPRQRIWIYSSMDNPPRLVRSRWFRYLGPDVLFEVIDHGLAKDFDDWMPAEGAAN